MCVVRCAIHLAFIPTVSNSVAIALAVLITVVASRLLLQFHMAPWPSIVTRSVEQASVHSE